MSIVRKTPEQIAMMRRTGNAVAHVLTAMRQAVMPGIMTLELDRIAARELGRCGAVSVTKNWPTHREGEGFPGYTCIGVNDEVVHGVPGRRLLRDGDVVTLDVTASLHGWCAASTATVPEGDVSPEVSAFLGVAVRALILAIEQVRPGRSWSLIAGLIQRYVERHGCGIVREYVGRGMGRGPLEEPAVPHFVDAVNARRDFRVLPGMTFTIEPMVTMGRREVVLCEDGWTVATADGLPAAHFRHTVAVTETGAEVLTVVNAPPTLPGWVGPPTRQ